MPRVLCLLVLVGCGPVDADLERVDGRTWSSVWIVGGWDRILVEGEGPGGEDCIHLGLVAPVMEPSRWDLEVLPRLWGVETATWGAGPCTPEAPRLPQVTALDGTVVLGAEREDVDPVGYWDLELDLVVTGGPDGAQEVVQEVVEGEHGP
jgi:hypothetical protein